LAHRSARNSGGKFYCLETAVFPSRWTGNSQLVLPGRGPGDSGYFWFFENTNVELMVKMLDGRAVNSHYWFFYGAMTDVAYTLTVTDTQTGAVKTYLGPQHVQTSRNDIRAF